MNHDYYDVLGLSPEASPRSVQAAYRKLAKECHPDRAGVTGTEKFQTLQEAYEVLSDPDKRAAYDSQAQQNRISAARYHITPESLAPTPAPHWVYAEPLVQGLAPEPFSDRSPCPFVHRYDGAVSGLFCDVTDRLFFDGSDWLRPFDY